MKLVHARPMFWTSDLEATIAFYSGMLEFILDDYNREWGWAFTHKDVVGIILALPNEHTPFENTDSRVRCISTLRMWIIGGIH